MAITLDGTNGITNSSWTTSTRPLSPNDGQMGYNTDTDSVEVYNGTEWVSVGEGGGGGSTTRVISVTDDINAALRITQAGTGDALLVEDEANPDSTPFVVKNDGKVGIGTSNPSYQLEVNGSEPTSRIFVNNTNFSGMLQIANPSNSMMIGKDRDGSAGWYGNSGEYIIACNGDFPLNFWTNTVKRMTIASDGNVGIGVTPSAWSSSRNALEVRSTGTGVVGVSNGNVQVSANIYTNTSGTNIYGQNGYGVVVSGAATSGDYAIYTAPFGTAGATATLTPVLIVENEGYLKFDSGYGSAARAYGCRAWVNFNGTGTVAIRASGNVSSITDNGTGNYTVNFTTAMPDANYAAATQGNIANNATNWGYTGFERGVRSATGYVVQFALTSNYVTIDPEIATVAIFR